MRLRLIAMLLGFATAVGAQETCTPVTDDISFCVAGENIADFMGMSIAFPNAKHVSLSEDDNRYGHAASVIPVALSGDIGSGIDQQSLVDVLIQNAVSELWVEPTISEVRFRGATANGWHGVQAEYRIVGLSERLGTNYVVDAYIVDDNSLVAFQSYSDADQTVTDTLRDFHDLTMQAVRVDQ